MGFEKVDCLRVELTLWFLNEEDDFYFFIPEYPIIKFRSFCFIDKFWEEWFKCSNFYLMFYPVVE